MLKRVRFFKEEFSDHTSILYRWAETAGRPFIMDRWDENSKAWVSCPYFIEVLGIGGSAAYDLISEEEAREILIPSIGKKAARKATREVFKQAPIPN